MTISNAAATYRNSHFQDRAALLDPHAYDFYGLTSEGAGQFDVHVPAGRHWYLVNGWYLLGQDVPDGTLAYTYWFHRSGGTQNALLLPAGVRLYTKAGQSGFAYVCKPELVTSLAAYQDGEALYYTRLERLKSMHAKELSCSLDVTTIVADGKYFPVGTGDVLIAHTSLHDGAWVSMQGADAFAFNNNYEISDRQAHRYGIADMYPIADAAAAGAYMCLQNATVLGDPSEDANPHLACHSHIFYYDLPADW